MSSDELQWSRDGLDHPNHIANILADGNAVKVLQVVLVSDGDSKSHSMILEAQPYGTNLEVKKKDCVRHVQKRMGTALRELLKRNKDH